MASKKTLTEKNLEALGLERLAQLLIEISAGDAAAKRRLRLELASAEGAGEVAKEVRKRLTAISRSRTFVDWQNLRALVQDLEAQRRAIVEQVAKADAVEALELMWRFLDLADPVFARCDDSSGTVIAIFHGAVADLGTLAAAAKPDPETLADRMFEALAANGYGQYDDLIRSLAPALGPTGVEHLKQIMIALSRQSVERLAGQDRRVIGDGSAGPIYADDVAERSRRSTVRLALMEIADIQGDVDAFIAQYDKKTRRVPAIAAAIAVRLLAAGRAAEAWQTIEQTEQRRGDEAWPDFEWEDARIAVLEALGRADDAQAARWSCFERLLSDRHLRDYLKRLPEFDDVEAEQRALRRAEGVDNLLRAISFLILWPAHDRAAALIERRVKDLDGDQYEILSPAAEALAGKHPLAATLLLRSMIDFSLANARSSRYRHAARHLLDCASLASAIADFGAFESHEDYIARLRRQHGRKSSFWPLVG